MRCGGAGAEPAEVIGGRGLCPECGRLSALTMSGKVNWHKPSVAIVDLATAEEDLPRCRRCQHKSRCLFDRPDGQRGQVCGVCYDDLSDEMVGITSARDT